MKTIALLNIKGGVGKTTSSTTIAHLLAAEYGKRVLLVDLDPQSNATSVFSENRLGALSILSKVFAERDIEALRGYEHTVGDLLINPKLDVRKVIQKTKIKNLDLLPAFLDLSEIEEALKADIRNPQQFRLKAHLDKVQDDYDYCIIDCSPSISIININGLALADYVLTPLKCDLWGVAGFGVAKNLVDTVSTYNLNLQMGGCFFVQWDSRTSLSKEIREAMKEYLGKKFIDVQIRRCVRVEEMSHVHDTLINYAPSCTAALDYRKLTSYLVKHF